MTGQEFIDRITKEIMERGKLQSTYTAADLTADAAAVGLWYRQASPKNYREQTESQQRDVDEAKAETTEKVGGTE